MLNFDESKIADESHDMPAARDFYSFGNDVRAWVANLAAHMGDTDYMLGLRGSEISGKSASWGEGPLSNEESRWNDIDDEKNGKNAET